MVRTPFEAGDAGIIDALAKRYGQPPTFFRDMPANDFLYCLSVFTKSRSMLFDELNATAKDQVLAVVLGKLIGSM